MNAKLIGGLAALFLLVGAYVVLPTFVAETKTDDYSAYVEGDEEVFGVSKAYEALDDDDWRLANVQASPLILKDVDAADTLVIIVGMSKPFQPAEERALKQFMEKGGKILLLDDGAYGPAFTIQYGIEYRTRPIFEGSADNYQDNQSFVKVNSTIAGKTHRVLLNGPTALSDITANETRTLTSFIRTSNESYQDLNNDGVIGVVDGKGPFNVGLYTDVGQEGGRLLVMSDSGWITDEIFPHNGGGASFSSTGEPLAATDNKGFLLALVSDALSDSSGKTGSGKRHGLVLFDESRRNPVGLEYSFVTTERAILNLLRSLPAIGIILTMGLFVQAVVQLLRLPGLESWYHRFLPNAYVPPPAPASDRELLKNVLDIQVSLDAVGTTIPDPVVAAAARDPLAIPENEVGTLLRRIARNLELDIPVLESDEATLPGMQPTTKAPAGPGTLPAKT